MYRVHATMPRTDAERLSEILAGLDPSPAAAVAIEEVSRTLWRLEAFCHDEERAKSAAAIVETEFSSARAAIEMLADRDWVAQSLAGLPAVHAGPFIVAGAHELGKVGGGKIPVWIEAGPAFGTGHHGTTKGCLLALAEIARTQRLVRVLDIGTGSGVLAIAALKVGARWVIGGDIDADSIRIAKENATNNKSGKALKLIHAVGVKHRLVQTSGPYDLVMANILARPLVSLSGEIARLAKPGGSVILSGLLSHQEPQVRAAYSGHGLNLVGRRRITGWSTLVYRRPAG